VLDASLHAFHSTLTAADGCPRLELHHPTEETILSFVEQALQVSRRQLKQPNLPILLGRPSIGELEAHARQVVSNSRVEIEILLRGHSLGHVVAFLELAAQRCIGDPILVLGEQLQN